MQIELETINATSVWNVMSGISRMKTYGGMIITNDDKRIDVIKARLEDNHVFYLQENGKEDSIPLLSIKEARPLSLNDELPTRRDEAPLDDKDDVVSEKDECDEKGFKPELCATYQGNDTIPSRLSSRDDYRSYEVEIPPPTKMVRSQAVDDMLNKKRKLNDYEEIPPTVQNTPLLGPSENALLEFPLLDRPSFIEPLPSPRRTIKVSETKIEEVEMIPKSEYNKLEDDFAKLLKLMFENNYSILKDACEFGYRVKIRDATATQRVYSVVYTFENKEDSFTVLINDEGKTIHMNVQDIITVIPNIQKTKFEPFYEGEPVDINDTNYWNFSPLNINGENVLVHKDTGIIVSTRNDIIMFEAVMEDKKYTNEQIIKIREWVKKCGIYEYPMTPIKERKSAELRAPRKQQIKKVEETPDCARKLDFTVRKSAELRAPRRVVENTPIEPIKEKKQTYLELVVEAITSLNQREGSSRLAIRQYIQYNKNVLNHIVDRSVRQALIKGVETGVLIKNNQLFKVAKPEEKDEDVIEFLKENINKTVKFNYKEEAKVVTVKNVTNTHLTGICNRDNIIKKYTLKYIYDIELVEEKKEDLKDVLREACKNKKSIFIKYSKGSIPDIKRPIRVIGIQNNYIIAKCLVEDSIRKFKLEHIELVM